MKQILVSGCSFACAAASNFSLHDYKVTNLARPGAGNRYIADSVIKNYSQIYDKVFVLFSGLWRLDLVIPAKFFELYITDYSFTKTLNDSCYIFSGGLLGSWQELDSSSLVSEYFKCQYKPADLTYLSDNSMLEVIKCINFLETTGANYYWSFIYNIFADYTNHKAGTVLGHIDKNSPIMKFVNWSKYIELTPFEYGTKSNLLLSDEFHLTQEGYTKYINEIVNQMV